MSEEDKKMSAPVADKVPAKGQVAETKAEETGEAAEPVRPSQPTAADLLKSDIGEVVIRKAKGSKNVTSGVVHILATFNNTKVSFTDRQGNVLSWSSAGKMNFRGSRKSTAYAAQVVTQDAGRVAMSHGLREVDIYVKGPGMGRDSAIRAVQALGLTINSIVDVTPVPHNGCRPPKRRRA
jgi:small subunit ribosomal protein S11